MAIFLGIDPGSRISGYGIIEYFPSNRLSYITSGTIVNSPGDNLPKRLEHITSRLIELIESHKIDEVIIEQVFVYKNVRSALILGQARGAALVAVGMAQANGLEVKLQEYSPTEVKKTVVGYGGASKFQIQYMTQQMLKLAKMPVVDAADALALTVCHAHRQPLVKHYRMQPIRQQNQIDKTDSIS